jgi:DNA-binding NtrC family response regulator
LHAELELVHGRYVLRDLDSRNGVFVNGRRVRESALAVGDVIRLGDCVGVIEIVPPGELSGFGEAAPGFFGGALLRECAKVARRVAVAEINLTLHGEAGTGKECLARAVHTWSGRPGRFVAVNCAASTSGNIAAELFGHARGAFAGAERPSVGHVRAADQGTLLLDGVSDLPLELQAQLLHVIERREVLPLGEHRPVQIDVKFVAATEVPLGEAVRVGRFLPELRARLGGFVLETPPLRARRADIVPLFLALLARHGKSATLFPILAERLSVYDWPQNVRELEDLALGVAAAHAGVTELGLEHVGEWLASDRGPRAETPGNSVRLPSV